MDKELIKLLYEDFATQIGFNDIKKFESALGDSEFRSMFYEDFGKNVGFKDLQSFESAVQGVKVDTQTDPKLTGKNKAAKFGSFEDTESEIAIDPTDPTAPGGSTQTIGVTDKPKDRKDPRPGAPKIAADFTYQVGKPIANSIATFVEGTVGKVADLKRIQAQITESLTGEQGYETTMLRIQANSLDGAKSSMRDFAKSFDKMQVRTDDGRVVSLKEYEEERASFDVTDGVGMDDARAIVPAAVRFIADIGLAMSTGGTSFYFQGYAEGDRLLEELKEENPDVVLDEGLSIGLKAGMGTVMGIFDRIGLDGVVGKIGMQKAAKEAMAKTLREIGKKKVTTEVFEAMVEKNALASAKNMGGAFLKGAAFEGLSEGGEDVLNTELKRGFNALNSGGAVFTGNEMDPTSTEYWSSKLNATLMGAILGGPTSVVFRGSANYGAVADAALSEDGDTKMQGVMTEITNQLQGSEPAIIEQTLAAAQETFQTLKEIKSTLPKNLSKEKTMVAADHIYSRRYLDSQKATREQELAALDESAVDEKTRLSNEIAAIEVHKEYLNDSIRGITSNGTYSYKQKDGGYVKVFRGEEVTDEQEISEQQYNGLRNFKRLELQEKRSSNERIVQERHKNEWANDTTLAEQTGEEFEYYVSNNKFFKRQGDGEITPISKGYYTFAFDQKYGKEATTENDAVNDAVTDQETGQPIDNFIAEIGVDTQLETTVGTLPGRMNNAEYIEETELNSSANELYKLWDRIDKDERLTPEQKEASKNKVENLINQLETYELATETTTRKTPARKTTKGFRIVGTAAKGTPTKYAVTPQRIADTGGVIVIDPDGNRKQGTWGLNDSGTLTVTVDNGRAIPIKDGYEFSETVKDAAGTVTGVILIDNGTGNRFEIENSPELALDIAIKAKEAALGAIEQVVFEEVFEEVAGETITEKRLTREPSETELANQLKTFTVGYAPFREGDIRDISDSKKAFQNKQYQKWITLAKKIAEELGITINQQSNSIGVYGETSEDAEASSIISVTGTKEDVKLFAAIMGSLSPDVQNAVMLLDYVTGGNAEEYTVTFKDKQSAEDFVKRRVEYGITDVSLIPDANSVLILDFGDFNHKKFIEDHGEKTISHERRTVEFDLIKEGKYSEIIRGRRDKLGGQDGGISRENLTAILELAEKRAERRSGNILAKSEQAKAARRKQVKEYLSKFASKFGIPPPKKFVSKPIATKGAEIKKRYDKLKVDNSKNPLVKASYEQLNKEVEAQYKFLTEELGITVEFTENDPYDNSEAMMADVYDNKHLFVFKGGEPHSFMGDQTADKNGVTTTEKFRAIHDYFGHAVEGNQFGKNGEEAAWLAHSQMFSPLARAAMTTETRGQNSWVNNSSINDGAIAKFKEGNFLLQTGQVAEGNKLIAEAKSEFVFADQKVDLLGDKYIDTSEYEIKEPPIELSTTLPGLKTKRVFQRDVDGNWRQVGAKGKLSKPIVNQKYIDHLNSKADNKETTSPIADVKKESGEKKTTPKQTTKETKPKTTNETREQLKKNAAESKQKLKDALKTIIFDNTLSFSAEAQAIRQLKNQKAAFNALVDYVKAQLQVGAYNFNEFISDLTSMGVPITKSDESKQFYVDIIKDQYPKEFATLLKDPDNKLESSNLSNEEIGNIQRAAKEQISINNNSAGQQSSQDAARENIVPAIIPEPKESKEWDKVLSFIEEVKEKFKFNSDYNPTASSESFVSALLRKDPEMTYDRFKALYSPLVTKGRFEQLKGLNISSEVPDGAKFEFNGVKIEKINGKWVAKDKDGTVDAKSFLNTAYYDDAYVVNTGSNVAILKDLKTMMAVMKGVDYDTFVAAFPHMLNFMSKQDLKSLYTSLSEIGTDQRSKTLKDTLEISEEIALALVQKVDGAVMGARVHEIQDGIAFAKGIDFDSVEKFPDRFKNIIETSLNFLTNLGLSTKAKFFRTQEEFDEYATSLGLVHLVGAKGGAIMVRGKGMQLIFSPKADNTTIYHESAHAFYYSVFRENWSDENFMTDLRKLIERAVRSSKDSPMAKTLLIKLSENQQYKDAQSTNVEYMAELLARLADGSMKIGTDLRAKLVNVINMFLKKFGLSKFALKAEEYKKKSELITFLKLAAQGMRDGKVSGMANSKLYEKQFVQYNGVKPIPTDDAAVAQIDEKNTGEDVKSNWNYEGDSNIPRLETLSPLQKELKQIGAPQKLIDAIPKDTELREGFLTDTRRLVESLLGLAGNFSISENTIRIGKFYSTIFGGRNKVLIHEAAHAATMVTYGSILRNEGDYTKEQVDAVRELNDIAWSYMGNTSTLAKMAFPTLYGTTNPYEFIAEFIANPKFREYIAENNPTKKTNVINYIWDNILKMLGVKKVERNQALVDKIQNAIDISLEVSAETKTAHKQSNQSVKAVEQPTQDGKDIISMAQIDDTKVQSKVINEIAEALKPYINDYNIDQITAAVNSHPDIDISRETIRLAVQQANVNERVNEVKFEARLNNETMRQLGGLATLPDYVRRTTAQGLAMAARSPKNVHNMIASLVDENGHPHQSPPPISFEDQFIILREVMRLADNMNTAPNGEAYAESSRNYHQAVSAFRAIGTPISQMLAVRNSLMKNLTLDSQFYINELEAHLTKRGLSRTLAGPKTREKIKSLVDEIKTAQSLISKLEQESEEATKRVIFQMAQEAIKSNLAKPTEEEIKKANDNIAEASLAAMSDAELADMYMRDIERKALQHALPTDSIEEVAAKVNMELGTNIDVEFIARALAKASGFAMKQTQDRLDNITKLAKEQNKLITKAKGKVTKMFDTFAKSPSTRAEMESFVDDLNPILDAIYQHSVTLGFTSAQTNSLLKLNQKVLASINDDANYVIAPSGNEHMKAAATTKILNELQDIIVKLDVTRIETRTHQQIESMRKLNAGDASEIAKINYNFDNRTLDPSLIAARDKLSRANAHINAYMQHEKRAIDLRQMSFFNRIAKRGLGLLGSMFKQARTLAFMMDMSAFGVQAALFTLGMPVYIAEWAVNRNKSTPTLFKNMWGALQSSARAFWTNDYGAAEAVYNEMVTHPDHYYRMLAGLEITRPGDLFKAEEMFIDEGLLDNVWGLGEIIGRIKKASESHMSLTLNAVRIKLFDAYLHSTGYAATREDMMRWADVINELTGRKSVKKVKTASALGFASEFIAAPRLYWSRLNAPFTLMKALAASTRLPIGTMSQSVGLQTLKYYTRILPTLSGVFGLLAAAGWKPTIDFDPFSAEFLKLCFEPDGTPKCWGWQGAADMGVKIYLAVFKLLTGAAYDTEEYKKTRDWTLREDPYNYVINEFANKRKNPGIALYKGVAQGTDYFGQPYHDNRVVSSVMGLRTATPIFAQTATEPFIKSKRWMDNSTFAKKKGDESIVSKVVAKSLEFLGANYYDFAGNLMGAPKITRAARNVGVTFNSLVQLRDDQIQKESKKIDIENETHVSWLKSIYKEELGYRLLFNPNTGKPRTTEEVEKIFKAKEAGYTHTLKDIKEKSRASAVKIFLNTYLDEKGR